MRGGRRADGYGRIGHFDMQRVAVGLGIDRNGFDPHAACGFDDPAGDLAAIGNQDSLEHCDISRMSRKKLAPDLIRGGYRFSDKDMRKVNTREPVALPLRRSHKNVNRRSPIEARGEGVRHRGHTRSRRLICGGADLFRKPVTARRDHALAKPPPRWQIVANSWQCSAPIFCRRGRYDQCRQRRRRLGADLCRAGRTTWFCSWPTACAPAWSTTPRLRPGGAGARRREPAQQPLGVSNLHDRECIGDGHRPYARRHRRLLQHDLCRL